jgi:pimeloyl-ACP methyl ester carboxylesterase
MSNVVPRRSLCRVGRVILLVAVDLALGLVPGAEAAGFSAVRAPVRTVRVSWGRIGYRSVGSGRPLLLLIGGGGPADSIDDWPPALIDALASRHRVIAMDYEGIGQTTPRPGTMTIPRLADDAAALIAALRLRRPDILGWSMGGQVAQALAIKDPQLIRRLILAATAPGTGRAIPRQVSRPPPYRFAYLFAPGPNNAAQAAAFDRSIHHYPDFYEGSDQIAQSQSVAFMRWMLGHEPIGHRLKDIRAQVLVADGLHDQLLPVENSRMLAAAIPHAKLEIDPDGAHGFLLQHITEWANRFNRFLS